MSTNSAPKLSRSISRGISEDASELCFKDDPQASQMLVVMNESRLSGRYCDIKLLIGENEDAEPITAHKLVLISFSRYFEGLLSPHMKEGSQDEIRIHNLHAPSVQNLVEFAYTGSILITSENIEVLLEAANFLAVDSVCQACCGFMEKNMNSENCVGILGCAEVYRFMTLQDKAFEFTLENFYNVAESEDIKTLEMATFKQLISSERLFKGGQVVPVPQRQEKIVLDVVCKFIQANNLVGSKESLELLKEVRMSLLDREDADGLLQSDIAQRNKDVMALIRERRSRKAESILDTDAPYWCRPRNYPGLSYESSSAFGEGLGTGDYDRYDIYGPRVQSFTGKEIGEESSVNGVKLWIGKWSDRPVLKGIQLFHRNGKTSTAGINTTDEQHQFSLDDNEYIVDIELCSGTLVEQLTFHTSRGRKFGPYGSGKKGEERSVEKPEDGFLAYITNFQTEHEDGPLIYAIRFVWGHYDYSKL